MSDIDRTVVGVMVVAACYFSIQANAGREAAIITTILAVALGALRKWS